MSAVGTCTVNTLIMHPLISHLKIDAYQVSGVQAGHAVVRVEPGSVVMYRLPANALATA